MSTLRLIRAGALLDNAAVNDLNSAVAQSASAGLLVQNYCTQIAQQPIIVIPDSVKAKLPPINDYLKTAQGNANDYLTNIEPRIIAVVTDVGGYATEFTTFFTLINGKINDWKGGSPTARTEALALLSQLQTDLQAKRTNVDGVQKSILTFQSKVNIDVSNFNEASSKADVVIGGDQGALAELDYQVGEMDKRIGGAAAGVALSGLTIIGGGLMIAAGAIASFITAGTSTPLVVAGVAVVVVGAAGLTASSIVLANLIQAKANLLSDKAQLQADLVFLKNFKSTVGTLSDVAGTTSQQLTNMGNAWGLLNGNLGNVITSVGNAQSYSSLPVVVQAYLDTASSQWQTVQGNVSTIEAQMTGVKTKVLANSQGGLGTLDKRALENLRAA
ncbi:HBL/NHE enterotoxin family protein [Paraburkholderia madseniana]|jgi:hypothetical protein|uniref:HBL/NHE enterotoxin family protein n=1 Tax=Paraburkholderia madseniana TaxID=2599607 RepID=UPI0015C5332A|nr:HBL/NHE enterotoxin family protein [Paraburkholderia madseniana]NPT69413.1 HBL/NHE enterotoxin family protein [Paraburkholderia madseniana]